MFQRFNRYWTHNRIRALVGIAFFLAFLRVYRDLARLIITTDINQYALGIVSIFIVSAILIGALTRWHDQGREKRIAIRTQQKLKDREGRRTNNTLTENDQEFDDLTEQITDTVLENWQDFELYRNGLVSRKHIIGKNLEIRSKS